MQINRLEGQVSRYKASADNSEKVEDELKVEKRKLQREVRGFARPPPRAEQCCAQLTDSTSGGVRLRR